MTRAYTAAIAVKRGEAIDHYRVVTDAEYGYKRLEPLPTREDLESFYKDRYYDLVGAGGRAPELRRFLEGGNEAEFELKWLSQTLWKDIRDLLDGHVPGARQRRLLDIGCGLGYFACHMNEAGWHAVGIEPSRQAAEAAEANGLEVYDSLEEYMSRGHESIDVVTLLNVLEHVLDPRSLLQRIAPLLETNGLLVLRVPNDFTVLQESAQKKLGREPWWIAAPDHINYFDFDSLTRLLDGSGFQVVDMLSDFPMELFLLFGDDYIENPESGTACHQKRVAFELSVPSGLRRDLYRSFAQHGVGRGCLVIAELQT